MGILGAGFLIHLAPTAFPSVLGRSPDRVTASATGSSLATGVIFAPAHPMGLAF